MLGEGGHVLQTAYRFIGHVAHEAVKWLKISGGMGAAATVRRRIASPRSGLPRNGRPRFGARRWGAPCIAW